MNRLPTAAVLTGWAVALAGSAATIVIGMNLLAAQAIGGLLSIFQETGAPSVPFGNFELIWPLLPAAAAVAVNIRILWFRPARPGGISAWWLVPALAIAIATLMLGVWACIDVWQPPPGVSR